MSEFYLEVPNTTDEVSISVPFGKNNDRLWQGTIMFSPKTESGVQYVVIVEYKEDTTKVVETTKCCVTNCNLTSRNAIFEYVREELKLVITVVYLGKRRIIAVEF